MPEPVYLPDGTEAHDIQDAVRRGEARFDGNREYDVVVGGQRVKIPGSEVWSAILNEGGRLETAEEQEIRAVRRSPGERIKAVLEGAASSATLGAYEPVAGAVAGKEYLKRARLRSEALPTERFAGELAGMVPGMLEGGAGALGAATKVVGAPVRAVSGLAGAGGAAVGRLAGGGRIARVLGMGATGAIEGGAYQVGREVANASLRDEELSAESILAAGLEGAKAGAALGAGLGSVAQVLGGLKPPKLTEEGLRKFSRREAARALHGKIPDLRRLGNTPAKVEARLEDVGEELLRIEALGKHGVTSPSEIHRIASAEKSIIGEELGAIRKKVDQWIEKTAKGARSQGIEPPVNMSGHVSKFLKAVDDDILHPMQQSDNPAIQRAGRRVNERLDNIRVDFEAGKHIGLDRLRKFQNDLAKEAYSNPGGIGSTLPIHLEKLQGVERKLDDTLDTAMDQVGKITGVPLNYKELERRFRALEHITGISGRPAVHDLSNATLSPTAKAVGIATAIGTGGLSLQSALVGAASAVATKAVQQHIAGVTAVAADALASRMAAKAQAARIGIAKDVKKAVKAHPASTKIASISTKAYLAYQDTVKRVQDDAIHARDTGRRIAVLSKVAPKTAGRVAMTLAEDREYLKQRIPAGNGELIVDKNRKQELPASAVSSFNRVAKALDDPKSVAEALKRGELGPEEAQALRDRRPELFETMKNAALDEMAELASKGQVPSHQTRLQLSTLIGKPLDPLLTPARMRNIQQMHRKRFAEAQAAPAPSSSGESARRMAERRQTDTERVATVAS